MSTTKTSKLTAEARRAAAVLLFYKQKKSEKEIAGVLNVSSVTVSRDLAVAREQKLVEPAFHPENISAEAWATGEGIALGTPLQPRLAKYATRHGVPAPRAVDVVYGGDETASKEERLVEFGRAAFPRVAEALKPAKKMGVPWGTTLLRVIEGGDAKLIAPSAQPFPLTGDPPDFQDEPWTASNLVSRLCQGRPSNTKPLSLKGIWPVIPPGVDKHKLLATLVTDSAAFYTKIFGNGVGGLVREMDAVLTSIGRMEQPWNMGRDTLVRLAGITRAKLIRIAAGDQGGVLISKDEAELAKLKVSSADRAEFENAQKRWTGITQRDLRRVCDDAAGTGAPGVVVVAAFENKARFFLHLVRLGLITQAIIDYSMEREINALLDSENI